MAQQFLVQTDLWPFVVSTLPARFEEAELEWFMTIHDGLLARREPYVTLTDCTAIAEIPSPTVRKRIGEWNKRIEADIRRYNVATAIVMSNALVRGALTALHWIAPPPQPTEVVGRAHDGARFLLQQLERNGVRPTSAMQRYVDSLAATGASAMC